MPYYEPYHAESTFSDCRHCGRPLRMHGTHNTCMWPNRAEPYTDVSPADAKRATESIASQAATMGEFKPVKPMSPWHPMTQPIDLKHLGKLGEELGECSAVVSRCIIQGIDEKEPTTGKSNREWLEDEIADVMANIALVTAHFKLDDTRMGERSLLKVRGLSAWHQELE